MGDRVECRLAVEKASGTRGATALTLVAAAWSQGIVTRMGDGGFGTVSDAVSGKAYPVGERALQGSDDPRSGDARGGRLRVKDELEFRLAADPRADPRKGGAGGSLIVALARRLPAGTILQEWAVDGWWEATLTRAPKRANAFGGDRGKSNAGKETGGAAKLGSVLAEGDAPDGAPPLAVDPGRRSRAPQARAGSRGRRRRRRWRPWRTASCRKRLRKSSSRSASTTSPTGCAARRSGRATRWRCGCASASATAASASAAACGSSARRRWSARRAS